MIWLLHAVCRWRRVLSEYVHPSLWIILEAINPRWARIRTVVLVGSIIVLDASCSNCCRRMAFYRLFVDVAQS